MHLTEECEVGKNVIFVEEVIAPHLSAVIPLYTTGVIVSVDKQKGTCTVLIFLGDAETEVLLHDSIGPNAENPSVSSVICFYKTVSDDEKAFGWNTLASKPEIWDSPDGDMESLARYGRLLKNKQPLGD